MSLFGKTMREVPVRITAFMPRAVVMLLLFAAAAQARTGRCSTLH